MTSAQTKLLLSATVISLFAACTGAELDKASTTADKAETYHLIRDWKRVIRYNCDGQQTSDKIETVRSPNKFVTIRPREYRHLYRAHFKNLTNESQAGLVSGNDSFTIDMAPTWLNMKVEEGLNEIQYEFLYCDELKKDDKGQDTAECAHSEVSGETGIMYIRVIYDQNWLEGQDVVKPTEDDCKRIAEEEAQKNRTANP